MPDASRQTVVRDITQGERLSLIPHFSFIAGSPFLFAPHQKLRLTSLTWPIDLPCQKITSLNYSDDKTFHPRLEPTSSTLLWSLKNFSFSEKPYWQAHHTPSHTWDFTVAFLEACCILHVSWSLLDRAAQGPVDTSRQNFTKCSRER